MNKVKFTWKLTFRKGLPGFRAAWWKFGAISYGVDRHYNNIYFVQIGNTHHTLFHNNKCCDLYIGKKKPTHSFAYYATIGNIFYIFFWLVTIAATPILLSYHAIFGCFITSDRSYISWWISSSFWILSGLSGLYHLIF